MAISSIDYDSVADLYDIYASTDYDFAFFETEIRRQGMRVLELTSGTGRLSIPLLEAGADLTCVDNSRGMLDVLSEKLKRRGYTARLIHTDVERIEIENELDLALFPFQSFMELVGTTKQLATLSAVFRALKGKGRFICTMHNPVVRRKSVDGCLRLVGSFRKGEGTLVVSGIEQGGLPVIDRMQFYEYFDKSGRLMWKRMLPMRFELVEKANFEAMASSAGFTLGDIYGGYDRSPFEDSTSPVMIWVLEKPGGN